MWAIRETLAAAHLWKTGSTSTLGQLFYSADYIYRLEKIQRNYQAQRGERRMDSGMAY